MRLLTYSQDSQDHVGIRVDDKVLSVSEVAPDLPDDLRQLLLDDALPDLAARVDAGNVEGIAVADITYRPLLPRPGKIICIGRNYAAHAAEGGAETPTFPEIFYRGATSLVAHEAPIIRPQASTHLDYEGEIAFVVGQQCRHATGDNALECIAGYTLFNDATLRDYQRFSTQWTIGKNFDGTGAFGPELVTADELPPGIAGLTLTTTLNGKTMQEGATDNLVFPVRTLVEILSKCMTLEPGDVVVTGTPAGVGYARKPPVWMKAGDRVEIHVPGLGTLANNIQDEEA
jgi:2-keto-4-pentenoate hydratase/2-oxohepta-3-ene-1,7-dioic acid hydratase in catechol pathway